MQRFNFQSLDHQREPLLISSPHRRRPRATPGPHHHLLPGRPTNLSMWTTSMILTNCRSLSVNGRFPHASRPGIKFRCKVPINHDTASLSFIGASLCFRFFSQNHLSTGEPMRLIFSINQPEQDFCKRLCCFPTSLKVPRGSNRSTSCSAPGFCSTNLPSKVA
jgi:hypothetical protein